MNDDSILRSVPRRLKLARLALVWEMVWPRLFPPLAVIGAFLVLAFSDLLPTLPGWVHALALALAVLAFAYAVA